MLDTNKILRVKGILSAKGGTQVPKFQKPAGPMPEPEWLKKFPGTTHENYVAYANSYYGEVGKNDAAKQQEGISTDAKSTTPATWSLRSAAEGKDGFAWGRGLQGESRGEYGERSRWDNFKLDLKADFYSGAEKINKIADWVNSEKGQTVNTVLKGADTGMEMSQKLFADPAKNSAKTNEIFGAGDAVVAGLNQVPIVGPAASILQNGLKTGVGIWGKELDSVAVDKAAESQAASFGGTWTEIQKAMQNNGQKSLLPGKENKQQQKAQGYADALAAIGHNAEDRKANSMLTEQAALARKLRTHGGIDQRYYAKQGGELNLANDFKIVISEPEFIESFEQGGILEEVWHPVITDCVESFKQGGNLKEPEIEVIETNTTQKSVIPEGALHKNKHHLKDVGMDDSELTKKGIPVVDNNGEQQAEIELNEIIFTLEVTKELEKRYKEFYQEDTTKSRKEEIALEAGKLLWKEILYNTDDRTGLIDTLKQGGSIQKHDLGGLLGGVYTPSDAVEMLGNVGEILNTAMEEVLPVPKKASTKKESETIEEVVEAPKQQTQEALPEFVLTPQAKQTVLTLERLQQAIQGNLNIPYVWGGKSKSGADCTGFVDLVFKDLGYGNLASGVQANLDKLTSVDISQMKPGDIIMLKGTNPQWAANRYSHAAIFLGYEPDGKIKVAEASGGKSRYNTWDISKGYYKDHWMGARRLPALSSAPATNTKIVAPNQQVVAAAVAQSKKGYYEHAHGGKSPITSKSHQNCTSGPATFYKAAGIQLNGHWWKTKDGKGYTWNGDGSSVDHTGIGEVGFQKVWSGSSEDAKNNKFAGVLQPGDIGISFGMLGSGKKGIHAQMWNGEQWISDFYQRGAWVFGNGWKGNDSFQLWRYAGKSKQVPSSKNGGMLKIEESVLPKFDLGGAVYSPANLGLDKIIQLDNILETLLPSPATKEEAEEIIEYVTPQNFKPTSTLSTPIWSENSTPITSAVATPIPTNLNLNGWDLNKTLEHLRFHAHSKSTHYCAKYVRQALEAGGLKGFRVPNAKDEVNLKTLESIGFKRIAEAVDNQVNNNYVPQAGDIAISYENGNHAAMYDGTRWISDFKQSGLDVYKGRKNTKTIIYRRIGSSNPKVKSAEQGGTLNEILNDAKNTIFNRTPEEELDARINFLQETSNLSEEDLEKEIGKYKLEQFRRLSTSNTK